MLGILQILVIILLTTFCFGSKLLFESKYYKGYSLEDVNSPLRRVDERREFQQNIEGKLRTVVEFPTNNSIPEDDGSATFGDILFRTTKKDGVLIVRDTIVNQIKTEDVQIIYSRLFPGYYVEDMKLFNVGRQRGYCYQAYIGHPAGRTEARMYIAANNTIRMFAEIYIRAEN